MTDIFISYARSTAAQAQQVAEALRALGYGVWRDDELPAHRAYADVIEERLQAAKAVVVVWSAEAVKSEWVQSEADTARTDRKLVQLSVDGSRLPRPFDRIQCADLAGWSGDLDTPGWRKVAASVAELMGAPASSLPGGPAAVRAPEKPAEPLLAVLAFDNLSGDPEMAYFSDGISEEIQETVARGASLKVIGRASSFQFRGADKAAAHVGAELGATHVLDGSIRRSGARVRISAQLVECARATTLWTSRFDRELTDIFELQDEIANAVAEALRMAFAPSPQAQSIEPAAYDLYLKARENVFVGEPSTRTEATDARETISLYEQAVALAPGFAAAWAGLAHVRAYQALFGRERDFATLRPGVLDAAHTALRLDPGSGLAYTALALLEPAGCHLERAVLLEKALAAAPNDPRILGRVSSHWYRVGRHRESLVVARQAYELDPLSQPAAYSFAGQTGTEGDYEESERLFDAFRAKWPTYLEFTITALNIASYKGDWDRFEMLVKSAEDAGLTGPAIYWAVRLGRAVRDRDAETAAVLSGGLRNQLSRTGSVRVDSLFAASLLGLKEDVFQAIEEASFAQMFETEGLHLAGGWSPGLLFQPTANRAMIEDPRFVGLCAKLGLCDYWVRTGQWPDCADEVPYDFRAEAGRLAGIKA